MNPLQIDSVWPVRVTYVRVQERYQSGCMGLIDMRWLRWSAVLLSIGLLTGIAMGTLQLTAPAQSQERLGDDLQDTQLDRHWVIGNFRARGRVTATSDGLRMTLTRRNVAKYFAHTVWLNCRIDGDFDARVSYELEEWPLTKGIRLGIGFHPDPRPLGSTTLLGKFGEGDGLRTVISERLGLERDADMTHPSGGEFYSAEVNGRQTRFFPTRDDEGELRVTRTGNELKAWHWDEGGHLWIPSGQWSVNPQLAREEEWVAFQLWGFESSPEISVLLTDFSISAQGLGCR